MAEKRTQHKGEKLTNNEDDGPIAVGIQFGHKFDLEYHGEYDEQDFESAGRLLLYIVCCYD